MNATTPTPARKKSSFAARGNGADARPKPARVPDVDSAEARSRLILTAMVAFRDGDFAVRLPADWVGTEARTAEAFNQTIAREERITQEMTRLSVTVGKEGRLQQRMSVPGAIGQWASQVDSINTMVRCVGGEAVAGAIHRFPNFSAN